ncbi:hypothetical protein HK100_003766 [Physocladia obscura]|uniref:Pentatricopeptide repeat-containing protein n=1 Tax=Physocladia obscura TaxID=109957 RepID=A0AAD5SZN9_9FUNG|nr:hypothetical protein HK100_003766 [Physocladia obscura]
MRLVRAARAGKRLGIGMGQMVRQLATTAESSSSSGAGVGTGLGTLVRTQLDGGQGPQAYETWRRLRIGGGGGGGGGGGLAAGDAARLLCVVASGNVGSARDVEALFGAALGTREKVAAARAGAPDAAGPAALAVFEARALVGDVAGMASLLSPQCPAAPLLALNADGLLVAALVGLARAASFTHAEAVLRAFIRRLRGSPKPSPAKLDKLIAAKRERENAKYLLRRREIDDKLIHAYNNDTPSPTVNSNLNSHSNQPVDAATQISATTDNDLSVDSLVAALVSIAAQKPEWPRYPPLPRDASPSLIKKRTRPTPPNATPVLIDAYSTLLQEYSKSNSPDAKTAILRVLNHMKENAFHTKVKPNNTIYSIAMKLFANTGDFETCVKLRDEALKCGLKPSVVLDSQVLIAAANKKDAEAGFKEIERIKETYKNQGKPSIGVLKAMIKVYALNSSENSVRKDAWGVIRSLIHGAKDVFFSTSVVPPTSFNHAFAVLLGFAPEIAAVMNAHLAAGKEIAVWDSWFDSVGRVAGSVKYGLGMVGFAAIGNISVFKTFMGAYDAAVGKAASGGSGGNSERVLVYQKSLDYLIASGNILEAAEFFNSVSSSSSKRTGGTGVLGDVGYASMIAGLLNSDVDGKEIFILGLIERMKADGVQGNKHTLALLRKRVDESKIVDGYVALL